jgi:hypothetical protein
VASRPEQLSQMELNWFPPRGSLSGSGLNGFMTMWICDGLAHRLSEMD